jgi:hypothetical protein
MTRDAKRKNGLVMFMAVVIFIGHWIDTYVMVVPGAMITMGHHLAEGTAMHHEALIGSISFLEVGTTIGFLGLLAYSVQYQLSKAPLVIEHHPMMEESLHHAI